MLMMFTFRRVEAKIIIKWECCNLGKTKEFLEMYINYNCKNQKIFVK